MPFLWPCYVDAHGSRGVRGLVGEFETFFSTEYIIQKIYSET